MPARLNGKVAVISGVGSGIGKASALLFASEGARIVGAELDSDAGKATVDDVTSRGGQMVAMYPCDMSSAKDVAALIELTLTTYGGIDILYNVVGQPAFAWMPDMSYEQWSGTLRQELDSVFLASTAAWPHLVARGGGSIINIASMSGRLACEAVPAVAHAAGKGGVIAMSRQLAMEGGKHGIRVNNISPGLVATGATIELMKNEQWLATMKRKLMLNGRVGTPDDVAFCAVYLASDEARWVTGADFAIDGGTTAW
jgi:NAD(P)-dependent dehydrogenase (short-subunit alcohol dehydrogenase family)